MSDPNGGSNFSNIRSGLLETFQFVLGGFDPSQFDTSFSPQFSILLSVLYVLIVSLLMLNLLIALMSNTFSNVEAHAIGEYRALLAINIMDNAFNVVKKEEVDTAYCPDRIFLLQRRIDIARANSVATKGVGSNDPSVEVRMSEVEARMERIESKIDLLLKALPSSS